MCIICLYPITNFQSFFRWQSNKSSSTTCPSLGVSKKSTEQADDQRKLPDSICISSKTKYMKQTYIIRKRENTEENGQIAAVTIHMMIIRRRRRFSHSQCDGACAPLMRVVSFCRNSTEPTFLRDRAVNAMHEK